MDTFLIVRKDKIVEVRKSSRSAILKKYGKTLAVIYQYVPYDLKSKMTYKKGDSIPFEKPGDLLLVKRKDKISQKRRTYIKETQFSDADVTNWFKTLSYEKINEVESLLKSIESDKDVFYRIFHNSLKMYRMRDYSFQLFGALNYLVGLNSSLVMDTDFSDQKFSRYGFLIEKNIKNLKDIQFLMGVSRGDVWFEDSNAMLGSMVLLQKTLESFIQFSKDYLDKTGLFFEDRSVLKDYEALVIDCYRPLNPLRGNPDGIKKITDLVKNGS